MGRGTDHETFDEEPADFRGSDFENRALDGGAARATRSAGCAIDRADRNTPLSASSADPEARDHRSARPEDVLSLSLDGDA